MIDVLGAPLHELTRILVVGVGAYVSLVLMLRISGKRTLAKLNAFDFVVTIALGSTLATILLDNTVSLAEGLLALALLIFLQFVVSWTAVRSPKFRRLIKAEPTLLFHAGRFLDTAMNEQRITRDDIAAALRTSAGSVPEEAASVVLEADGTLTVSAAQPNK